MLNPQRSLASLWSAAAGALRTLLVASCVGLLAASTALAQTARQWISARDLMVQRDIVAAGIRSATVVAAMRTVPRHEFVPADQRAFAYYDMSLPIGEHQTISPPFFVAHMTELLDVQGTDKVLEIGTGSGYQAAILGLLAQEVYTIELVPSLGRAAADRLKQMGYKNVKTRIGDGYQGWAEQAPFDKLIVTCSPEKIPTPLVEQLREGGLMEIPLGERYQQTLYLMRKVKGKMVVEAREPTFFVPMNGAAEEARANKPRGPLSSLVNGSFEESQTDDQPSGWYYVRQATIEPRPDAGADAHCLTFRNTVPGRAAQALQAVGVDGSVVGSLEVEAWVRAQGVKQGPLPEQLGKVLITYFDEDRAPAGQAQLGPWSGSFDWTRKTSRVNVPRNARLAVVAVGLIGATGELSVDEVQVRAAESRILSTAALRKNSDKTRSPRFGHPPVNLRARGPPADQFVARSVEMPCP